MLQQLTTPIIDQTITSPVLEAQAGLCTRICRRWSYAPISLSPFGSLTDLKQASERGRVTPLAAVMNPTIGSYRL